MMNQGTTQQLAGARFRGLMIIWGAQVFSLVPLFVVTQLVGKSAPAAPNQMLLVALAAVALASLALSFVLKSKFVGRAVVERRPDLVTTGYVLAFMLCDASTLCGLLLYLTTGARESRYFLVVAAVGLLLNFPRRRHVEDASGNQAQMLNPN